MKILSKKTFSPGPGPSDVTIVLKIDIEEARKLSTIMLRLVERGGQIETTMAAVKFYEELSRAISSPDFTEA